MKLAKIIYMRSQILEEKEQQDSTNGDYKEISDESLKVTNLTGSRPTSLYSETEQELLTRWVDLVTLPLMMAYVTRYIFGTDKLRPNSFEVRGLNGISTGIIHCDDTAILSQWLKYITDNIIGLTNLQVRSSKYFLNCIHVVEIIFIFFAKSVSIKFYVERGKI